MHDSDDETPIECGFCGRMVAECGDCLKAVNGIAPAIERCKEARREALALADRYASERRSNDEWKCLVYAAELSIRIDRLAQQRRDILDRVAAAMQEECPR